MEQTKTQPLEPGFQLVNKKSGEQTVYHIEKVLGRGGFGITYLATAEEIVKNVPQETKYTIKEFCNSDICQRQTDGTLVVPAREQNEFDNDKADFLREAGRLMNMHCNGIVPVNEVFETNGTAYYVMQYLGSESLVAYVKDKGGRLEEDEAKLIIRDIANALGYLHDNKVTHLDVKPENIMMLKRRDDSYKPILIDFGLACHYKSNGTTTSKHSSTGTTDGYSPLEQYAGIHRFSPQADIYAMGATFFFMLTGKAPLVASEMSMKYLFKELPDGLSDDTVDALRKSMEKMAEKRIATVGDFLKILFPDGVAAEGGEETVKRKPKKPITDNKLLKYGILGLAALVVVVLAALLVQRLLLKAPVQQSPAPDNADTTIVDKPSDAGENQVAANHEPNHGTPAPQPAPVQQSTATAQAQSAHLSAQHASATASSSSASSASHTSTATSPSHNTPSQQTSSSSQKKYLDLGYAEWRGPVKNGQPHGDGIMTFKSTHRIESRDSEARTALPGDYVDGTYVNGHLSEGSWYGSSGEKKGFLLIGQ